MADLELAASYVGAHGTALDRARVGCLLGRAPAERDAVLAALGREAGPQGGFAAAWSAGGESVDATCGALESLADLGAWGGATAERALRFLSARTDTAGAVVEADLVAALTPEWADPTRPGAVRYLTAQAGAWLARSPAHRNTATRAARYLDLAGGPAEDDYPATAWLTAAVLRRLGEPADALLQTVASWVEDLGPESLTGIADAVPDADVANAARFRLTWRQEEDGRWASELGPDRDVAATVAAVRALRSSSVG